VKITVNGNKNCEFNTIKPILLMLIVDACYNLGWECNERRILKYNSPCGLNNNSNCERRDT
jgi:hypothetical protein